VGYIHLSSLLQNHPLRLPYDRLACKPHEVNAVIIDLLDLYIHHLTTTHIGPQYALQKFMDLQISIRKSLGTMDEDDEDVPRERDINAGDRGSVRFILDRERVFRESEILENLR
jgi:hypothetical protein